MSLHLWQLLASLPVVFFFYWLAGVRRRFLQNAVLLTASYALFGWLNGRLLLVILLGSLVDWALGFAIERYSRKGLLLSVSVVVNLGVLGLFKYHSFFVESLSQACAQLGLQVEMRTLHFIAPIGISFWTLQRLTYPIEISRGRLTPTKDIVAFLAFSSFFPLLLAGPIERATRLLPQFLRERTFSLKLAKDSLRMILWGMFRKIVVADVLASAVDECFEAYASMSALDLLLGLFLFAIQLYADFAAYSDIARGMGGLLGFKIVKNFSYPYFSSNISEFWQRWHISMSSWFRDYVYTPLSLKVSVDRKMRRFGNILLTFGVSGLWHGPSWAYVTWGVLHGIYFLPLLYGRGPKAQWEETTVGRLRSSARRLFATGATFAAVLLSWVFFRADSVMQAFEYLGAMGTGKWMVSPGHPYELFLAGGLLCVEWLQRDKQYALDVSGWPLPFRWGTYIALIIGILVLGEVGTREFFYVQF